MIDLGIRLKARESRLPLERRGTVFESKGREW